MFETPQPDAPKPKTCVTCAHLVGRRAAPEFHEGWLCGAPPNIAFHKVNLVSGVNEPAYRHRQCLEARAKVGACGPEGAWWELAQ